MKIYVVLETPKYAVGEQMLIKAFQSKVKADLFCSAMDLKYPKLAFHWEELELL